MRKSWVMVGFCLVLAGCSESCRETAEQEASDEVTAVRADPGPARDVTPEQVRVEAATLAQLHSAVSNLGNRTKVQLMARLEGEGPASALEACAVDAAQILSEVGSPTLAVGDDAVVSPVVLGRSSHRLRNPANAGPEWVMAWLEAHRELPAKKAKPLSTVVETDDGPQARVLKPLSTSGPCLLCHGPKAGLTEDVQKALATRYPDDHATGFLAGDLRGVIYAQADIRYLAASASESPASDVPASDAPASDAPAAGSGH